MPKYDLHCPKCVKEYSIWASITEKSEKRIPCPDCGSYGLETVFKAAPAYVKGGGKVADCPQRSSCGSSCPRMHG